MVFWRGYFRAAFLRRRQPGSPEISREPDDVTASPSGPCFLTLASTGEGDGSWKSNSILARGTRGPHTIASWAWLAVRALQTARATRSILFSSSWGASRMGCTMGSGKCTMGMGTHVTIRRQTCSRCGGRCTDDCPEGLLRHSIRSIRESKKLLS